MPTKLEQLQLQFRQKLMQEKEERMIKIHTDSQQKALNKVLRYDANGPTASSSHHQSVLTSSSSSSSTSAIVRKPSTMTVSQSHHTSPVKKGSPGVDRSRPLPPIHRNGQAAAARGNVSAFSGESSATSSTSSSSYSARVTPPHNGARSRSVDPDGDRCVVKPSVKVKHRTDISHATEAGRYHGSHQVNNGDRRSPDAEVAKPKQPEVPRSKVKASYEAPTKVSNGLTTSLKSSVEQRTMAGNSRNVPTISTTMISSQNRKPKATVSVVTRRTVNGAAAAAAHSRSTGVSSSKPIPRKPPNPNQEQCRHCGRNFNKDRIEKHVSICSKMSQKKVKVFDVTKMRVKGTEAESFVRKGIPADPPKAKKTNWKKQHEDFINTIRQAKLAQRHLAAGGKLSDLPPPPPSDTSSYVPCPYCGRKFDEGVAQRHIPKCKNIVSNKKMPMKKK